MKKTVFYLFFFGVIVYCVNLIFGADTITFISKVNINNQYFLYKIDTWKYLENLRNSFDTISMLILDTPSRPWSDVDIINNLAVMTDWVIFALNVFLYPFRLGGYVTLQIMSLIGINTIEQGQAGGLNWLVTVGKFLRDLQIPFI